MGQLQRNKGLSRHFCFACKSGYLFSHSHSPGTRAQATLCVPPAPFWPLAPGPPSHGSFYTGFRPPRHLFTCWRPEDTVGTCSITPRPANLFCDGRGLCGRGEDKGQEYRKTSPPREWFHLTHPIVSDQSHLHAPLPWPPSCPHVTYTRGDVRCDVLVLYLMPQLPLKRASLVACDPPSSPRPELVCSVVFMHSQPACGLTCMQAQCHGPDHCP